MIIRRKSDDGPNAHSWDEVKEYPRGTVWELYEDAKDQWVANLTKPPQNVFMLYEDAGGDPRLVGLDDGQTFSRSETNYIDTWWIQLDATLEVERKVKV